MRLLDLPHADARRLLASGAPVVLPVNPVEYHGPHLSLHNDRLVSAALAARAHELAREVHRDAPHLVADDLEVGVEPCPGPGTRHTPFVAARALVREAVRALVELGARRIVLSTFHGSPLHAAALEAGVALGRSLGAKVACPFNVVTRQMIDLDDGERYRAVVEHLTEQDQARVLSDLPFDFHAGFFETSLALWAAPESVSSLHRELPRVPVPAPNESFARAAATARALGRLDLARELAFASVGVAWQSLRPFPGYTGSPGLADARSGAGFAEEIARTYAQVLEDVLYGDAPSPPPILPWSAWASLGGVLPAAPRASMGEMRPEPRGVGRPEKA